MDSTQLCSFLLTMITGTVLPGHILGDIPVTEKSYELAFLPPFVDGLNSLTSVAETLLNSTDLPQAIQNVQQLLESSHKSMSKAEQSSLAQVKSLSTNVEERLDKINHLNDSQEVLRKNEQDFKVQLAGPQGKESLDKQLQTAQKNLKDATDAIERTTKAFNDAAAIKQKGIGMVFLPIAGPIIGGIMISKANANMQKALKELGEARKMRTIHKKAVERYESQIESLMMVINSTEQTIAANKEKIQVLQQDLNSERALHQNLNKFVISLRNCTSLLSTVAGKTSAANMNLELSGVLDGLLGVLGEIIVTLRPLVESSTEYSLLISARLPTIIHKLEEANRRLKKAAAS